jgi:hypothetical protein
MNDNIMNIFNTIRSSSAEEKNKFISNYKIFCQINNIEIASNECFATMTGHLYMVLIHDYKINTITEFNQYIRQHKINKILT